MMLQHLTLNTGNLVAVPQSASVQRAMRQLRPIVEAGSGPLPDEPLWHLHLMPLADGATMMQIADEPGLSKRPIVMGIAAWRAEVADQAWDLAMQCYLPLEEPLRMVRLWRDPPDAPKQPWLTVWLLPHIITADRDTLLSLGRVEQAVAMLLMGAP